MATPMIKQEFMKPTIKHERRATVTKSIQKVDDKTFEIILERRLKAHASTWKELAKR